jgi:hypothetical protein
LTGTGSSSVDALVGIAIIGGRARPSPASNATSEGNVLASAKRARVNSTVVTVITVQGHDAA